MAFPPGRSVCPRSPSAGTTPARGALANILPELARGRLARASAHGDAARSPDLAHRPGHDHGEADEGATPREHVDEAADDHHEQRHDHADSADDAADRAEGGL